MRNGDSKPKANGTSAVGTDADEAGSSGVNGTAVVDQTRGNGEASTDSRTGAGD